MGRMQFMHRTPHDIILKEKNFDLLFSGAKMIQTYYVARI